MLDDRRLLNEEAMLNDVRKLLEWETPESTDVVVEEETVNVAVENRRSRRNKT